MLLRKPLFAFFISLASSCSYATPYSFTSEKTTLVQVVSNMVLMKGGEFRMGAQNNKSKPVKINGFYLSSYPITWEMFKSYKKSLKMPVNTTPGDLLPFYNGVYPAAVTIKQAKAFCGWVARKTGLPAALISDKQWEYAARSGGKNILYSTNNNTLEPGKNLPSKEDLKLKYRGRMFFPDSVKVNKYPPNSAGIYLMGLNGVEWTKDKYYPILSRPDIISDSMKKNHPFTVRGTTSSDISDFSDPKLSKSYRNNIRQLLTVYNRLSSPPNENFSFRCVINTNKPIPKKWLTQP
jgi:formylglycine-generating enzyme required for sulfatase activity